MDKNFLKTVSEYTGLDIGDIGPDVLLAHYKQSENARVFKHGMNRRTNGK